MGGIIVRPRSRILHGHDWVYSSEILKTFGNPEDLARNIKDAGYFIYSQPIAMQNPTERTARKAPVVQIAAKESGAIHSSNVIVQVN